MWESNSAIIKFPHAFNLLNCSVIVNYPHTLMYVIHSSLCTSFLLYAIQWNFNEALVDGGLTSVSLESSKVVLWGDGDCVGVHLSVFMK